VTKIFKRRKKRFFLHLWLAPTVWQCFRSSTVDNRRQPGFPGCRPTDLERSAGRHDICRLKTHLLTKSLHLTLP